MARLITEGFENGDTLIFDVVTGAGTHPTGRISGKCWYPSYGNYGQTNFTASAEVYFRCAFLFATTISTGHFQLGNATDGEVIRVSQGGTSTLLFYVGGSLKITGPSNIIKADTWHVLEVRAKIDNSTGIIQWKFDGVEQTGYSWSGDTQSGSVANVDYITINSGSQNFIKFDDLALNNTTGGADNSWCGDGHCYCISPNANGDSSQFTGSDGNSTDNYLLVDEVVSNGDTDYVESSTTGQKDLYNLASLPTLPTGSVINRVMVDIRARELTADGDSIYAGAKSGATENWSSAKTLSTNYKHFRHIMDVDPNTSAAWTEANVNAMQAGVKVP